MLLQEELGLAPVFGCFVTFLHGIIPITTLKGCVVSEVFLHHAVAMLSTCEV